MRVWTYTDLQRILILDIRVIFLSSDIIDQVQSTTAGLCDQLKDDGDEPANKRQKGDKFPSSTSGTLSDAINKILASNSDDKNNEPTVTR